MKEREGATRVFDPSGYTEAQRADEDDVRVDIHAAAPVKRQESKEVGLVICQSRDRMRARVSGWPHGGPAQTMGFEPIHALV